jgi:hypothetical protein
MVPAITTTSEASHPRMNAAPLNVPRSELSTRMNPVMGIGSIVTAAPMRIRSKTAIELRPVQDPGVQSPAPDSDGMVASDDDGVAARAFLGGRRSAKVWGNHAVAA